jgi:tRNA(Ile2) C34 agmatinyltransferase TiaS
MESREAVSMVKVRLYCDECGGRMKSTGYVQTTYPPKYPHKCADCGCIGTYNKQYPYYEEDE